MTKPKPEEAPVNQGNPIANTDTVKALNDTAIQIPTKEVILENELIKLKFSSKGARILEATIKNHYKIHVGADSVEQKLPLSLLEDVKMNMTSGSKQKSENCLLKI